MPRIFTILAALLSSLPAVAAPKTHAVTFGKLSVISWRTDDREKPVNLKIRPLYVDGRLKDFTIGTVHDVTERTFVAQRIYRINDSLPQETGSAKWRWQLGGWLLVDRTSGKVQSIALPEFDPDSSLVNWFRDYAAYCGISSTGEKVVAVIVQLGQRKPLLKKAIGTGSSAPTCPAPTWERNPVRATFAANSGQNFTFALRSRAVETFTEDDDDGGDE